MKGSYFIYLSILFTVGKTGLSGNVFQLHQKRVLSVGFSYGDILVQSFYVAKEGILSYMILATMTIF